VGGVMSRFTAAFLVVAVAGISGNSNASAADMQPTPSAYALPPRIPYAPPAFSWTGFYVGVNLGWAWTRISDTVTITGLATGTVSERGRGFLAGGQAGFNWQIIEPVILGIEADFQGTSENGPLNLPGAAGAIFAATAKTLYFGTVRGRIGYAFDRLIFYGTGGTAFGNNTLTGTASNIGSFDNSVTYWSWTAGGGIEAALGGRFTAKLEYLYLGSSSSSSLLAGQVALTNSSTTNLVRAGLNYRL
jgi:outer membrane immunogenic protein